MSTKQTQRAHARSVSIDRNDALLQGVTPYVREQLRDNKHRDRSPARARANELRANASLPEASWEAVDDTVYPTMESTLRLVNDLRGLGLVQNVDIQAKVDTWHMRDTQGSASVDMDPETTTSETTVGYDMDGTPVPIIHDDFSLGFRDRPADDSVDPETDGADAATRNVSEAIEDFFVGGTNIKVVSSGSPFTSYGMTDHPATATGTTTADWTADNTVIRSDFRSARSVLKNDRKFRPGDAGYLTYLGTEYYDELDDADPEGSGDTTVRDRVENLANIEAVRELDALPGKSMLMFRPTQDVIEVGIASDIQPVQWEDPFRDYWKILGSMYPRIKQTMDNENGILYWTAP